MEPRRRSPLANVCPECGFSNPRGNRYCGRCGTRLREGLGRALLIAIFFLGILFVFGGVLAARYAAGAINASLFEGPKRTPIPYVAKTSTPTATLAALTPTPSPTLQTSPDLIGASPSPSSTLVPSPAATATKASTATPMPPSPTPQRTPAASPSPAPQATPIFHVVVAGDTMFSIARRYGVSLEALGKANGIDDPNRIVIGQRLIIPPPAS